jgi:superoxide reductase
MASIADRVQHADWKNEKHVPVIECPDTVKKEEIFEVKASIGKEINHPNTTEHHIRWISLYFQPDNGSTYVVGNYEFSAHGESTEGANQGPVYSHHAVTAAMKLGSSGTLYALGYCNIHGLWESSKEIKVQ